MPETPDLQSSSSSSAKSGTRTLLFRKIGPLPVVAWVAIGAAALLAVRAIRGGGGFVGQPAAGFAGAGGGGPGMPDAERIAQSSGTSFTAPIGDPLSPVPASPPTNVSAAPRESTMTVAAPQTSPTSPAVGPSAVIPTSTSASLAAAPIAWPSGGPLSQEREIAPPQEYTPPAAIVIRDPSNPYAGGYYHEPPEPPVYTPPSPVVRDPSNPYAGVYYNEPAPAAAPPVRDPSNPYAGAYYSQPEPPASTSAPNASINSLSSAGNIEPPGTVTPVRGPQ